jgi:hypothetical protein
MIAVSLVVGLLATVLLLPTVSDLASLLRLAVGGRRRRAQPRPPSPVSCSWCPRTTKNA